MRVDADHLHLSAGDLTNHLACRHLTGLDRAVSTGNLEAPQWRDPALALLQERGLAHEEAYVRNLREGGLEVVELRYLEGSTAVDRTEAAMHEGADAIVQASLRDGRWGGRADVLLRVEGPSALGNWSYEVVDTKLALETRGGTVLQLCLYTDLVAAVQGRTPEHMHVVKPGEGFARETFRFADFQAYYRLARGRLEAAVGSEVDTDGTYPDPCAHCDVCGWWQECDRRRHDDDHLCLVAGLRSLHIAELQRQEIHTLEQLAVATEPLRERPQRGHIEAFERAHAQARIQLEGRRAGKPRYELLPFAPGQGLTRLPEPSPGDVFFDIESDQFVEDGGREYLLGVAYRGSNGDLEYRSFWGLDHAGERAGYEKLVGFLIERWERFPGMHVYHFSPYEPAALKRLMGRHGVREQEMDRLLRGERFVDLLAVTRQGLRASVESYSLKALEPFFGFERDTDLRAASAALRRVACALELWSPVEIDEADLAVVEAYNREDCLATAALRDWLEERRAELADSVPGLPRPEDAGGDASEGIEERAAEVQEAFDGLVAGLPEDREEWGPGEHARWLLAHQLEYFRREDRCAWWEFFRIHELDHEELLEERKAVAGLELVGEGGGTAKCPIHRYRFPIQEAAIGDGDQLHEPGGEPVGSVAGIDQLRRTIDVKKRAAAAGHHPSSVFVNERVNPRPIDGALLELARSLVSHGIDGDGPYRAGRDLLLRRPPRLVGGGGGPLRRPEELAIDAAVRLVQALDQSVLPIQGPPGSGKTFIGARMIVELVRRGKRIGVTAVSHKVIRNLLDEVLRAAEEQGVDVNATHKVSGSPAKDTTPGLVEVNKNEQALAALTAGQVVGGTAWLWARDDVIEAADVLFVDEAGQMSLAVTLGASRAAKNLVLLGDPQQLEQPQRGAHPEGAEVAALVHVLDGHKTIADEAGLFLDVTWRLHPEICNFTSELYYEGRLRPKGGLERQAVTGNTPFAGSGLFYVPVEHEGNQNRSLEEVEAVVAIVDNLLAPGVFWVDAEGVERPLDAGGVLVVAPYNAQVGALSDRLPENVRVGTVDKFQGQQAPVVIYSAATSSAEEAPRGMSFLYNPNRLNVATSRARCACILVAAPKVIEPDCRTPEQMRWANGLCRFRELARVVEYTGGVLRTPASVRTEGNQ